MAKVSIYYKMTDKQGSLEVIDEIENLISTLNKRVTGVYIDAYNNTEKFSELISKDLSEIDAIFLNKPLQDEFNRKLIEELSRTSNFNIVYFDET